MIKTIYIIGERTNSFSIRSHNKFRNAQLFLEEMGFRVINPIETLENTSLNVEDALRTNIKFLLGCDAVYIMPSVSIDNSNVELNIALQLNMYIIQGANFKDFFLKDEGTLSA